MAFFCLDLRSTFNQTRMAYACCLTCQKIHIKHFETLKNLETLVAIEMVSQILCCFY